MPQAMSMGRSVYGNMPSPGIAMHHSSAAAGTLGLCLQNSGGHVIVDNVDPSSPNAAAARPGDVIAAINGTHVLGLPLSALKPLLAGPVGMAVRLKVLRPEGEVLLSLVRHEAPGQSSAAPLSLQGGQLLKVPMHKLVVWDHGLAKQVATPWPRYDLQLPEHGNWLDVTVVDVENLPVCYDIGWSMTSIGTGTASPFVEASLATCRLRTSSQSSKLSAAINQTLRLNVVDTSPLRIRVMNDDVSVGGHVIGEIKFPMQQIAMDGFQQKGRFRITVVGHHGERIPTLQHLNEGDEVTGLKQRPSTVQLELAYKGRPFSELQQQQWHREELERAENERRLLEAEHVRLMHERVRAANEEKALRERDRKEAEALALAATAKVQREAKVREQVYALSKTKLAEQREAWLLGRRAAQPVEGEVARDEEQQYEEQQYEAQHNFEVEAPLPVQDAHQAQHSKPWWDLLPTSAAGAAGSESPPAKSWWDALPKVPSLLPGIASAEKSEDKSAYADTRNLANVELVLDMEMSEIGHEPTFKREVEEDVLHALHPRATKVDMIAIRAGSVIVDLEVQLVNGVLEQVLY